MTKHSGQKILSALLELLPSACTTQCESGSSNLDFITLLVSAYPDLQPWCVREASVDGASEEKPSDRSAGGRGGFYTEYLSALLHNEYGNDAAKRDKALVKVRPSLFVRFFSLGNNIAPNVICANFVGVVFHSMLFSGGRRPDLCGNVSATFHPHYLARQWFSSFRWPCLPQRFTFSNGREPTDVRVWFGTELR